HALRQRLAKAVRHDGRAESVALADGMHLNRVVGHWRSDDIGESAFVAGERADPEPDGEQTGGQTGEHGGAGRWRGEQDPAGRVEQANEGIEGVRPAPLRRYEAAGVRHRACVQPDLHEQAEGAVASRFRTPTVAKVNPTPTA